MELITTLLYISYTIPLVCAQPFSQTTLGLFTPTQDYQSANLTYPGTNQDHSSSWNPRIECLLMGKPNTIGANGACNNLPKYSGFDGIAIPPGDTTRIAITLPGYILDVSCSNT